MRPPGPRREGYHGLYRFRSGAGRISVRTQRRIAAALAAADVAAELRVVTIPGAGRQHWFECEDRGEAANAETARDVDQVLQAMDPPVLAGHATAHLPGWPAASPNAQLLTPEAARHEQGALLFRKRKLQPLSALK